MLACDPGVTGRKPFGDSGTLLPARAVWERYAVTGRTLDRWIDNPTLDFPKALIINKRRYFRLSELEAWERQQAAGRAA